MVSPKSERLVRMHLAGFRGVADEMTLSFPDRHSMVIFAGNGNGKSTVADALEYYFTGKIESLRRESREHHVRHVAALKPTSVEVKTTGVLGDQIVGHPHPGKTAATAAGNSELFLLHGHDLAEFVDKTKMDKWRTLARILGFAAVDELRADLQTVMNDLQKEATVARDAANQSAAALSKAGPGADPAAALLWLQARCQAAAIEPPKSMETVLDEKWQPIADIPALTAAAQRLTLAAELEALETPALLLDALHKWNAIVDTESAHDRSRRALFEAASAHLVTHKDALCPLCGQAVSLDGLRARITLTLDELQSNNARRQIAEQALTQLIATVRAIADTQSKLLRAAGKLGVLLPKLPASPEGVLERARTRREATDASAVATYSVAVTSWADASRAAGATLSAQLADLNTSELAHIGSVVTLVRTWHAAAVKSAAADRAHNVGAQVHNAYADAFRAELRAVFERLSVRVAQLYSKLHPDEALSGVSLETFDDKGVELALDFHGSRQRPPNGVLSESHMNSLGLALFLALAEAANERLGFLVLDDPITSFDAEHRATLADLLINEFEGTQLVVLTHDPLFYRRLAGADRWNFCEFTSWSFDGGPTQKDRDPQLLAQARLAIPDGDMQGAGSKGRRALEELLKEICEKLKVPVPYRRGMDNDLRVAEELLNAVRGHLKDKAKHVNSELAPLFKQLAMDIPLAFNVETHASVYLVSPSEMQAALDHVASLEAYFQCSGCGTQVWRHGTPASFRCKCGKRKLSLEAVPEGLGPSAS